MGHAPHLNPVFRAGGLCIVGAFILGSSAATAEEGWGPVVVKIVKEEHPQSNPHVPAAPHAAPAAYNSKYRYTRTVSPVLGRKRPAAPSSAHSPTAASPEAPSPAPLPSVETTGSLPDPDPSVQSTRNLPEPDASVQSTGNLPGPNGSPLVVAKAGESPPGQEGAVTVQLPSSDLAHRYCVSIADEAAEARIAWQKAKLAEAEQQIDKRIAALEAKTAEYRTWLERREKFSRKVTKKLVQIYAKMEPDAAAMQLVSMDEEAAASILAKLDPRNSSAILNEMQPAKAARLAATLVGAARTAQKKRNAPIARGPAPDGAPQPNADGGGL